MAEYDHLPILKHKIYLVQQVEQNTCIWDSINDRLNYNNENAKVRAFNLISRNMNEFFGPPTSYNGKLTDKKYCIEYNILVLIL